jgi:hypothetical protein
MQPLGGGEADGIADRVELAGMGTGGKERGFDISTFQIRQSFVFQPPNLRSVLVVVAII